MSELAVKEWLKQAVKQDGIDKYLIDGKDFIDELKITETLKSNAKPDKKQARDILQKSLRIERLEPAETAALLHVTDPELWEEMYATGLEVKRKVYDNRIVFFAPLYCSNLCVNNCAYCGFRLENQGENRRILSIDEVKHEAEAVISEGHKRMIVVYGEHVSSDADYMAETIKAIYTVKKSARHGEGSIRRVNINAAPMSIADLKKLGDVGIGTYQVFHETYHKPTYASVHPEDTIKGNFRWRLYALHRAMEAGIDDLAIGALFGLYDWRFEIMGLLYHAIDMERQFGIGPHTISFPRMMPAAGSYLSTHSKYLVNDSDFKKLVTVLRLSVPYTGLIITARESAQLRREIIQVGCTQTDASTKIGIGGYTEALKALNGFKRDDQDKSKQQFLLGDTRSLDEVIRELAEMGMITSFCTAGYRCGRTGDKIMGLLQSCTEAKFCKLNAVLTFREYLDDYASPETKVVGEKLIQKEIEEIRNIPFFKKGNLLRNFEDYYHQTVQGKRDVYI
ncbi:MAG: [FeFe] hydrogenase H-cluster radical SAM maturase HydG [Candidatus Marinimicrobia bacterium]|nr:[FeFe] hydrogenase H-cluster radical SAM maturase HydG [bacterium]MCG2715147.1 [FeFe] hydrogenase H-cluster radical SAM maturase HydG [Candidatus Neomarinimicrobiota bacterium]